MNSYVLISFITTFFAHPYTPYQHYNASINPIVVQTETSANDVFFAPSNTKNTYNRLSIEQAGTQLVSNTMVISDEFSQRLALPSNDITLAPISIKTDNVLIVLDAFGE